MTTETIMSLRTPYSPAQIKSALLHDPALTDMRLVERPRFNGKGSEVVSLETAASVRVEAWVYDDHDMIDGGFDAASVYCQVDSSRGSPGYEGQLRLAASVLRLVPGDVCLSTVAAGKLDLLRLGGVVYISPNAYTAEDLTDFGYDPDDLRIGIPDRKELDWPCA